MDFKYYYGILFYPYKYCNAVKAMYYAKVDSYIEE